MSINRINRRSFIQKSSLAAAAISSGVLATRCTTNEVKMPMRTLGKTGEKISILGYGCGSQFMLMEDGDWEPHLEHAYNEGINYFDTASTYGEDAPVPSEERLGKIIPSFRKNIFLLTKMHERDPETAKKEFERSLKRLKTDHVDALLIHTIGPRDTLMDIEKGVYQVLRKFKEEKTARYIGFSSMDSAEVSKDLIENLEFDVTLLAMNATSYGNFVDITLPSAREKNLGIISMKIMRDIVNKGANPQELLEYNWSLPDVAVNVVAMTGMEPLKQNIEIARNYGNGVLSSVDSIELENRMAHLATPDVLSWARPGYYDGMIC
ncbi:aldo/keto reductase [Bacteroidota bacterium]